MTVPARSHVDRPGKRLRDHRRGVARLSTSELSGELSVVDAFRVAHEEPLTALTSQLSALARQVSGHEPEVGQRPKRMETIIDKLVRQPTMRLSRMHDIAGCRAVMPDQPAADALIDAVGAYSGWTLFPKTWDYVAEPKPDGYRAKHLVVTIDGLTSEIQVRTTLQHAWPNLSSASTGSRPSHQVRPG